MILRQLEGIRRGSELGGLLCKSTTWAGCPPSITGSRPALGAEVDCALLAIPTMCPGYFVGWDRQEAIRRVLNRVPSARRNQHRRAASQHLLEHRRR